MALDIDGFATLRSVAGLPSIFRNATSEVAKFARTLVIKQIRNKTTDLKTLREVARALGANTFSLIVEGMLDAQIKTLVTRIDRNHPQLKGANPRWRRQHLITLANGSVEPTVQVKPHLKRPSTKKVRFKQGSRFDILSFSSAGLTRKR
jgi:hypothetical protein